MPAISKIRFTNVIYENGGKRYNDDLFEFDGHNGAIILENGGGKTVFIQTALQAVLPHTDLAERKIKNTLSLEGNPCHITIEWILNERPRRYGLTAVTLFLTPTGVDSYRYAYEYGTGDKHSIENIPFVKATSDGKKRPVSRGEISDYYQSMQQQYIHAKLFKTIKEFHQYIEENFNIISTEWQSIARINSSEGDVDSFFDGCKTTSQLVDQLLIPVIEDALAGNGTEDFVETFEKQREHFKKHKQLRGRIEESQRVAEGIDQYVQSFAIYHEAEVEFIEKKQVAKGLYQLAKSEKSKYEEEIFDHKRQQEEWQNQKDEYRRKEASYHLALLKNELANVEVSYEHIKAHYEQIKESMKEKEQRLADLEVAELKKKIQEHEEKVSLYEKQLNQLNADQQVEDLYHQLQENSGQLKGYFTNVEQKLEKERDLLISQNRRYKDEIVELQDKLNALSKEKAQLEEHRTVQSTTISIGEKDMDSIANEILAHSFHEKVEEEQPKWRTRSEELEKQSFYYREQLGSLRQEKESLENSIPQFNKLIQGLKAKEASVVQKFDSIQDEQNQLLQSLKAVRGDWHFFKSLYEKQATITTYLEEKVERCQREREQSLLEERLAHRLQDDYGQRQYFTAEPLLDQWVQVWGQSFNLLETGSQYLQRAAKIMGISLEDIFVAYPFWALAVITSKDEVEKLYKRLEEHIKKLTHPVLVLSEDEAKEILYNGEISRDRYIFPNHWQINIDSLEFDLWKRKIQEVAHNATTLRQRKESEHRGWTNLLMEINRFFDLYPYDSYQQLQKSIREVKQELEEHNNVLRKKEEQIKAVSGEIKEYEEKLKQLEQESMNLGHKMQRAQEYFNKKNIIEKALAEKQKAEEELLQKEIEIRHQNNSIDRQKDILDEIKGEIQKKDQSISSLRAEGLYREVSTATPSFNSITREALELQRDTLKEQIDNKQKGRSEIQRTLESVVKQRDEYRKQLNRTRNKYKTYSIDETLVFPLHGEVDIEELTEQINGLKETLDHILPELTAIEEQFKKRSNTYELREEDFHKEFKEMISFSKSLQEVELELQWEKEHLENQLVYLSSREKQLNDEVRQIDGAIRELEVKHERYNYLARDVKEITLSQEIFQEFPYRRMKLIKELIGKLDATANLVEERRDKLEQNKHSFIGNCNKLVQDIRLREVTVTGIQNKKGYEEVVEWQQKMKQRILRTIELVENDMREHDRELQQFIHYLHTYLYTVSQELRLIPKNTRVKVEGAWKEIFSFDVPEWQEQNAKEELRRHIDWMLSKLEADEFKDEHGNENQGQIRKSIEKWLQVKQLLQNVMKDRFIKVKCRKVTNDGKVMSSLFSWETSNLWSGGEKWSKNMALFLGILNYVAEKRQHVVVSNKRSRTVIMDNPFGKASSEHVLQPVFFIAEQLGFQMIALTAHAEGKFIGDYFPVVYSCKLRPTVDGLSSVMGKEKIIRYTFFQDHDPETLLRIGEQEQLTLFK